MAVMVETRRESTAATWVRLFRPHHAPLSMSAGLAGMALGAESPTAGGLAVGILVCFSGYSLGQVTNDYVDRKADAINAPWRPMVSGAVNPLFAVGVATVAMGVLLAASALVAPGIAVWGIAAIIGHGVYSATKGVPMLGNVVNGVDLALFSLIGSAAAAPERAWYSHPAEVWIVFAILAVALSGFCLSSYFKDMEGDAAAGYRTIPVVFGERATAWVVGAQLAATVVLTAALPEPRNAVFWLLLGLGTGAFVCSVRFAFVAPRDCAYEIQRWSVRGCVLLGLALAASAEPGLMLLVGVGLVWFLEAAYRDTRQTRQP